MVTNKSRVHFNLFGDIFLVAIASTWSKSSHCMSFTTHFFK